MSKYIKIAAVQFDVQRVADASDAPAETLKQIKENMVAASVHKPDLVVFCEGVESRGMLVNKAESLESPGVFLECYREFAVTHQCHIAGSVKLREEGKVYNSVVIISPSGEFLGAYHKTFLTTGEVDLGMSSGKGAVIIDTEIGRIGGVICFDLNYNELLLQYREEQPDIIVFPSMFHGGLMQATWAYQCQSYFVGALFFHGTGIRDPFGRVVDETDCHHEIAIARVNMDRVMLHNDINQDKFDDIRRKYGDKVRLDIPKNIGCCLLFSESDEFTAMDIVKEFGLELRNDYFERSKQVCLNS